MTNVSSDLSLLESNREPPPSRAVTEHPPLAGGSSSSLGSPPGPSRRRRVLRGVLVAFGLLATVGALASIKAGQIGMLIGFGEQMKQAGPPPEVVGTIRADEQIWESTLSAVASVVSAKGVALSNDSPGLVSRLHFESGATVKQGQVLVELDSRVERAQLASLRARRDLAETSLARSRALVASGAVAQSQVDNDEASFKSLSADAAALEAQIARKVIRAPFSGKLGLREVNLGQYLAPGTRVAVLESTESVYVDFSLPQRNLQSLKPGMVVRAFEEAGGEAIGQGVISAIDPGVDAVTRSSKVRASFPNQDERWRPGMFVRVEVVLPEQGKVVAVPLTSVVRASYGDSLFVVDEKPGPDGKPRKVARQQFVKLGASRGDFVAVLDGLKSGEEVVSSGAFKLRNGLPLKIDDKVKLAPALSPRPENR